MKPSEAATACACSTSRPLRSSFSIGHQRAIASKSTVVSGTSVAVGDAADLRLGDLEGAPLHGTNVDLERAPFRHDVRSRPA